MAASDKDKVTAAPPPLEFPVSERISGGTLKDYQRAGYNWLCTRYAYAIPGAIVRDCPLSFVWPGAGLTIPHLPRAQLADEMGTGKTLQTIAVFAFVLDNLVTPDDPTTDKPLIVVLPKAVLRNWEKELAKCVPCPPDLSHIVALADLFPRSRFAPSIPVLVYAGTPAERAELRQRRLGLRGENNAKPYPRKEPFPVILVTCAPALLTSSSSLTLTTLRAVSRPDPPARHQLSLPASLLGGRLRRGAPGQEQE